MAYMSWIFGKQEIYRCFGPKKKKEKKKRYIDVSFEDLPKNITEKISIGNEFISCFMLNNKYYTIYCQILKIKS